MVRSLTIVRIFFSTGIILYELLAVRRMFEGETMHVLSLVREAQYDPPEEVIPDLPAKLNQILRRALAKDPQDRYQSAGDMLADVEECAFEMSLRPNARNFAQYMKALFEEEYAEEELALWAKTKIYEAGEAEVENEQAGERKNLDDTFLLTKDLQNKKPARINRAAFRGIWQRFAKILPHAIIGSDAKTDREKKPHRLFFSVTNLKPLLVVLAFLLVVAFGIKQISFSRSHPEDIIPISLTTGDKEIAVLSKLAAGKAALEAGRFILAATLFEEIVTNNPSMKPAVEELFVKAWLGQATELLETDALQAEKFLLKALEMDPDNISGLSNLAYISMGRKDFPKAIENYMKVVDLAPQLPDTFFNLGYVYAITDDYKQAKLMYRRVVELAPPFTDEALFNLAVINNKLGEYKQSIKNLEQAVALNPANEPAKKFLRQLKKKSGDSG